MYTDAATKSSPGPTGLGILIINNHKQTQVTSSLETASNHMGEFAAAIHGFKYLINHYDSSETILFYTDSRLLSDAVGKNYSKHYGDELTILNDLINHFTTVITQWIPEAKNHGAHHLANQALHKIE